MKIEYRSMKHGEEEAVSHLVMRVFNEFVAPDYNDMGIRAFATYAHPDNLYRRRDDHRVLLALVHSDVPDESEPVIAGMIEIRHYTHIALLFVDRPYQRQGISRALINRMIQRCQQHHPHTSSITVNASPYAEPVYLRLGFVTDGEWRTARGVLSRPMKRRLTTPDDT